jgi:hypothetical protein
MGYITKYGSLWGQIPVTTGSVFWVAPSAAYTLEGRSYSASDDNDGLSPERAFRTADYAVGKCTANVNDVIVMLPGAHSGNATVTADIAGITITGIPGQGVRDGLRTSGGSVKNRTSITTTETAGMIFTVTAVDVEISWLHLIPITAGSGVSISTAAHRSFVHNCTFAMGSTANTATMGVTLPVGTGATGNIGTTIRNCYFNADGAVGPGVRAAQTTAGLKIESSTFELTGIAAWAKAIQTTLLSNGTIVRDCDFLHPTLTTTVITAGIDTTGATADGSTQVYRCYFAEGIDAIVSSATSDVSLAESYMAGATGGVLRTSA